MKEMRKFRGFFGGFLVEVEGWDVYLSTNQAINAFFFFFLLHS